MTPSSIRRPSLQRRLVLLAAVWSVVILAVSGLLQIALFRQASIMRFDDDLRGDAQSLFTYTTVDPQGQVYAPPMTDPGAQAAYSGDYWEIAEPAPGRLHALVRSRSLWDSELSGPPEGAKGLQVHPGEAGMVFYDTVGPQHEPLRASAMLTYLPGRATPVIFMTAEDVTPVLTSSNLFTVETVIGLIVLGAGLILLVFIQVRVGLGPLFALQKEVADVRVGKADRVVGDYPSELEPLAAELNALVAHDREVVERQRTHVGNLAHALKTPLSVMLAEAERDPGPLADTVERQAEAMRDHVDHHLRRARAAARSQAPRERTAVAPVLEELSHALERIFRDQAVTIDWRCPETLFFQGERQDLLEMLGNVLENACKFSKRRVRADAEATTPGRLVVVVEDDGPGLPGEQRAEVFKRGERLDETAPGTGLGLSIVEELARAYGGAATLGDSSLGGLRVTLDLPRAES
ncbi:MAG TPA: ATP-binding protein [Caulobacteraceae bacterium]|nr:ATP-binding protein [Caulobacteraceae bacterium]